MSEDLKDQSWTENDIAIVGMAAHLPGSSGLEDYWSNLRDGVESIEHFSEADLREAGESLGRLRHKNYVPAAAVLRDFEKFDAEFFGLSPKEAAIMDPQHRQFLEVSWEALENAGHMPERFDGPIGVYAGCGMGSYFYFNLCSNKDLVDSTGMFLLRHTGNDKDFLSTRLSHILDLKGPSVSVQTACSTSLVATHYACQALLNGECNMALAGGVTIELPHKRGYIFEEGEILSPDGHCHAFDHRAQGTVFGSGAGVVVLRRLADAIADGDHIWAVIRGTAVNNDGSDKAGYLAPSVDGQAAAIAEAQGMADVTADTIDYVECHGTGTYLGDPIEVSALTEAFRQTTDDTGFCKIGSVKTNIGHLDTAAGAASLIKTALGLHHREIPPSLGFEKPNPVIDFETSPFRVNDTLSAWESHAGPRRAGVNSLGVGGTNAHVVVEEAPPRAASEESDWPFQLLTISGRTKAALDANSAALAAHLRTHPEQSLADVAYTLQNGRRAFEKRRVVVARDHAEAADLLESKDSRRVFDHTALAEAPEVVFMFPGGGAQYVRMGQDLYETEPVFQEWMDHGLDVLQAKVDYDVKALWLAEGISEDDATERLKKPSLQLPLIMIVEYALAQLWISWGIKPDAFVGHSMGENTAACLAGVMSFEDCIGLVLLRGQLFDTVPAGGMLSIPLSSEETRSQISEDIDIASENAPDLTVVSGPQAALETLQAKLASEGIETRRIPIDIAAHSRMLDPILDDFCAYLQSIQLRAPSLPIISNRSGQQLSDADAMDPDYWVAHLRNTVQFGACMETLASRSNRVYLEVGPGKALSSLARMQHSLDANKVLSSLRHPDEEVDDDLYMVGVLGRFWACGVAFDWSQIWGEARRNKVVLPSYAFQRSSYFIEPGTAQLQPEPDLLRIDDMTDWGYRMAWRPAAASYDPEHLDDLSKSDPHNWLIFMDAGGVGHELAERLQANGHRVTKVHAGDAYSKTSDGHYILSPERGREGYDQLLADMIANGNVPDRILHLWLLTEDETHRPGSSFLHRNLEMGFHSLLFLGQAMLEETLPMPAHLMVATNGAVRLAKEPLRYPEKATIRGPLGVMPREIPGLTCVSIDLEIDSSASQKLLEEMLAEPQSQQVLWRGQKRYDLATSQTPLSDLPDSWRNGETYFVTGGFGGIGLTIAEDMLKSGANVVLQTRCDLPDRSEWEKLTRFRAGNDRVARRIKAVQRLEALDGKLLVVTADVCNLNDMIAAAEAAKAEFGPITGVIHAAGVINDAPILSKTSTEVEDVLAPKVHGTLVLDQVFADGSVDWIALFSSTSTVTTPAGQVDYVAANAFLNAYATSRAQGKTKMVAVNWGVWADTGMAAESLNQTTDTAETDLRKIDAPILQEASVAPDGTISFSCVLSTKNSWVLDQHRTKAGEALLPGTGYLELISEAMQELDPHRAYEVRDLMFIRAFHVAEDREQALRVVLKPEASGYQVQIMGAWGEGFITHAQATLALTALQEPQTVDLQGLKTRLPLISDIDSAPHIPSPQEAHLRFGANWHVVRAQDIGESDGVAQLSLPESLWAQSKDMSLHPGLLDLGTGWAISLINGYSADQLWVPLGYEALRHYGALPPQIFSWVTSVKGSEAEGTASFDIVLCDVDGNTCVEVDGLTMKRLTEAFDVRALPEPTGSEILYDSGEAVSHILSPGEQRLLKNLEQGIPAALGPLALRRALASRRSDIIVSSMRLDALVTQVDSDMAGQDDATSGFERPDLETDFVPPSNDLERTLAAFWQDLLGVDEVGVEDNFFDLGGHSLIAVRLFAMVKKTYQTEFPISVLFEAPTIAQCARLIEERIGPQGDDAQGGEVIEAPIAPKRRYTHLVPMHRAATSSKTPFFLVAGMFGNVLNLRHLGHLIGSDRPFYGLQARGLFGDVAPHANMEEAARDYIAEMQEVQPRGPYLLGGFSGGGITAFEIARQLEAKGETVSLLVMLDTPLPQRRALTRGDRIDIQLQELRRGGLGYIWRWAKNRILWEIEKRKRPDVTATGVEKQFHDAEIEQSFLGAIARYSVSDWGGTVSLYRPPLVGKWQVGPGRWVDKDRAYVFDDNDWGQYLSDLTVREVPGDHDSMVLEPNVRVLANLIRKDIEKAEAKEQTVIPFRKAVR